MSVDFDWERLTCGPDGEALAESIRAFIDHRFQQISLPKMISSLKVHSFEFGDVPPELELKDVSDPLPDFYDDDDDDDEEEGSDRDEEGGSPHATEAMKLEPSIASTIDSSSAQRPVPPEEAQSMSHRQCAANPKPQIGVDPRAFADQLRAPLSRSSTPGIPGGTSNMGYFHLPLSAGLSGAATPFGAFGGPHGWLEQAHGPWHHHETGPNSRRLSSPPIGSSSVPDLGERLDSIPEAQKEKASDDLQIVARIRYSGDVKLTLAADILLDYPMPSFVGIPLQLKVTGMTFDGIAILAYIKKKAHFCFLSPEDADALVGEVNSNSDDEETSHSAEPHKPIGKLFEQIRVESEIGNKGSGNLRNVSKVEKFILEQVRRMFESELVYPSFWTFLV